MNKKELVVYMRDRHQRLKTDSAYKAARALQLKNDRLRRPEFFKAREFAREMKKYGISVDIYRDKLIAQQGLCALCSHLSHHHGTLQRLQVDHNHACCDKKTKSCGKCVRGLLCADCNILLSYLERFLQDIGIHQRFAELVCHGTWTERALQYLARYRELHAPCTPDGLVRFYATA